MTPAPKKPNKLAALVAVAGLAALGYYAGYFDSPSPPASFSQESNLEASDRPHAWWEGEWAPQSGRSFHLKLTAGGGKMILGEYIPEPGSMYRENLEVEGEDRGRSVFLVMEIPAGTTRQGVRYTAATHYYLLQRREEESAVYYKLKPVQDNPRAPNLGRQFNRNEPSFSREKIATLRKIYAEEKP